MLFTIFSAFFVCFICLLVLLYTPLRFLAIDKPNSRSLHVNAIPRTGGLAIMLAVLLIWFYQSVNYVWPLLAVLLVLISLADDVLDLPVRWRFLAQVIITGIFIWQGFSLPWLWSISAIFVLVWVINLFNFMDGADGLAGGMALFGFSAFSIAAYQITSFELIVIASAVTGASLAFLWFNFNPAKIFMGDGGSIPLGFLVGSVGLYGWQYGVWPIWFPILVFSPFIVDATATLVRRMLQGEKIWQAHRSHYYQRLIQAGWGHKKTALAEYILMIATSGSALFLWKYEVFVPVGLFCWLGIYVLLMWKVDRYWQANQLR